MLAIHPTDGCSRRYEKDYCDITLCVQHLEATSGRVRLCVGNPTGSRVPVCVLSVSGSYRKLRTEIQTNKTRQTQWPLIRERTIPTDRPPLVDNI
jgi:hypothetical protein